MKLTKKLEAEILELYHSYWDAYLKGDFERFASMLDDNVTVIGSAVSEVFNSKEETVRFYRATADQMTGKAEFRNRKISLHVVDRSILVKDQSDLYVLIDGDWTFYGHARISGLLVQTPDGWKLAHQHGSFPDSRAEEGEQLAAEQVKKENLELKEAVKRRTVELVQKNRELAIEASLERVRAVAMGMMKPDDVLEICKVMFSELQSLGFSDLRNALINFWDDAAGVLHDYDFSDVTRGNVARLDYNSHPTFEQFQKKIRKAQDAFAELVVTREDLESWKQRRRDSGEYEDPRLDNISALYYYFYSIGVGALGISTFRSLPEEKLDILKRFRNVFDLAYRRYLDIEKAEAQAREAQIEAALERVRSRSIGMQRSAELKEVIQVVYEQFIQLNIHIDHAGFVVDYQPKGDWHFWIADQQAVISEITVPYYESVWGRQFDEAKENGESFFATLLNYEEKNKFYKDLLALVPGIPDEAREFYFTCPGLAISTALMDTVALYIENFSGTPYSAEDNAILLRFGKVFQQTYTRFLDLLKAEAQAKEAQIEASLERVRSKAMAMHDSRDISETVDVFFKELKNLDIIPIRCGVGQIDEENRTSDVSATTSSKQGDSYEVIGKLKLAGHPVLEEIFTHWQKQKEYYPVLKGEGLTSYYNVMNPQVGFPDYPAGTTHFGSYFYFPEGLVYAWTEKQLSEEEIKIFRRFTSVIALTYRRYMDLQKAEAQAKEGQIQLALERVRMVALGLNKSEEMLEVAKALYEQLLGLGFSKIRNAIIDISNGDGVSFTDYDYSHEMSGTITQMSYHDDPTLEGQFKKMAATTDDFFELVLEGKELQDLINMRLKNGEAPDPRLLNVDLLTYNLYSFGNGAIGISNFGVLSEEEKSILDRFRNVFTFAYKRYNDLAMAEAHALQARQDLIKLQTEKKRAEDALTELRTTQMQLIQSEKMASLGELTAGIAHEIKNPLNFVTNFSELGSELLDELREEVSKGDAAAIESIVAALKQNLEKINLHGKRADGIVKSMLQHSRTGSGQKESTDINELCDEYMRLAYHGLRAKDKSFNATCKTELDPSVGTIEVMAQEMGRVILNLINNALYAVSERKKKGEVGYEPAVTVATKREANNIVISVRDNGTGIPEHVVSKVFQPFFTTKPTGQGTGLGLSLAYDIVKAHRGELKVETNESKGTEFIIHLPSNTN